jgi:hypothetical protein
MRVKPLVVIFAGLALLLIWALRAKNQPSKSQFSDGLLAALPSEAQVFDVRQYGRAVCDGVTDDTAAIQKTINAAFAARPPMGKVTFSGGGMCKATVLRWPDSSLGWFVTEFDAALTANHIYLGNFNAFIGHTSGSYINNPLFPTAPRANWIQTAHLTENFVEVIGKSNVFIDGIHIRGQSIGLSGLYIHDNAGVGSIDIYLRDSSVSGPGSAILINSSAHGIVAGFSFTAENCSIGESNDQSFYDLDVTNFGMMTIRGGYLGSVHYKNSGIPTGGDVSIEDVLSESLKHDFFFSEASPGFVGDITLKRVRLADPARNVYMLKAVTTNNQITNVKIEMSQTGAIGTGLIDPASTPTHLGLICEGAGCNFASIYPSLYFGQLTGPRGPTIIYGSSYQPKPLQVVTKP